MDRSRAMYILFISLMLLAVSSTAHAQGSATLTIGSGGGTPNSTFTVPVSMTNSVPVAGVQFDIIDSGRVAGVDTVIATSRLSAFSVTFNRLNEITTRVIIFTFSDATISVSSGAIVNVTFRVRSNAFSGTTPLRLVDVVLSDSQANRIPTTVTNGTVTVTGGQVPDTTPPAAPTGLTATAGDRRATLNWNASTEADLSHYVLFRTLSGGAAPGDSIARIPKPFTTYPDIGLINDVTYTYRLIAVDLSGNKSGLSAGANVKPVDLTPPVKPVGLVATPGDGQVALKWIPNNEADLGSYVIYRNLTGVAPDSIGQASSSASTFLDTGLTNGTTYTYRIAAVDLRGNKSGNSNPASATPQAAPDTTAPAAPQGLIASAGDRQIELRWLRNIETDLSHYILYRSVQDGFTPTSQDSIARPDHFQTTFTDKGLTNGVRYYYRLVAVDFAGNRSQPGLQTSSAPDIAPVVRTVIPFVGPTTGGTPVVINGENFQDGATVSVGGVSADSVRFLTNRVLSARVPPGTAGRRNVTVTNPGGRSGTLQGGFLYVSVDSVRVVVKVSSIVDGLARTDTVHTATVPEGLPYILPPTDAPVTGLQTLYRAMAGLSLEIPPEAVPENMTIVLDIRNVTVRNDSTLFAPVHGKPSFFFVHPTVVINGVEQPGFAFSSLAAAHMTLLLNRFNPILHASGVDTTAEDTLALAYVTDAGLTQEGMISRLRLGERFLIGSLTRLGDLAGVRQRDILTNTGPPVIVGGPFATPGDTAAAIAWRTDKLTTGRVEYGTNPLNPSSSVEDTNFVAGHAVVLGNLERTTRYYYRVISRDERGQSVVSAQRSFTTVQRPDVLPPMYIVAPQVLAVSRHGAVIGWTTDEESDSAVEYGPTTDLGQVRKQDAFVYRHVISLTGLEQDKKYYALVSSRDHSGNVTLFPDTVVFTTLATPDSLPPHLVRRPIVTGLTPTSAVIQWRTDEPSDGRVLYQALGTQDTMQAVNPNEGFTLEHSVTLTGLTPDTPYRYAVRSTDMSGNTGGYRIDRFRTPAMADTLPPVIIRGPAVLYTSDRAIAIGWITDEISDGFVYYKGGQDGTFIPRGSARQSRRHIVVVTGLEPGVQYTFAVTSTDASGNTAVFPQGAVVGKPLAPGAAPRILAVTSSELTVTTSDIPDNDAPVIISGPTVVARTSTSMTLAWETDEPGDSRVLYGPGLDQTATDEDIVTAHQVTVTNLSPGTTYQFQVGSTDPGGNGPSLSAVGTATTSATPDTDPPVILSGTVQTAVSNDRITVTWKTDEPGDSFVTFGVASNALNDMADEADPVTAHTVVLTNLTPNTAYYLRASTTDIDGNGPTATPTLMMTTAATADTARPVISDFGRQALAVTDTTATLTATWTTDRLATRRMEYGKTKALGAVITDGTTGTGHQMTASRLALNTKYFFRIGSAGANDPQSDRLAYSGIDSLITPAAPDTAAPAAPTNLTGIPGNGAVRIRWTAPSSTHVTGYTVFRNGTAIATAGPVTAYLDVSAQNGTAYSYTVRSVSAVGKTSGASAVVSTTPNITKAPTAPAASTPSPGDTVSLAPTLVVVKATPVFGDPARAILTYEFQVAADTAFTTLTASITGVVSGTTGNPTHWQVADAGRPGVTLLDSGVKYWWRVRANDGEFPGVWSTPSTFVASSSKPTGITLAAFQAADERGVVTLDWTIANGQEPAGFHVLRSRRQDSGFEWISTGVITAKDGYTLVDRDVSVNMVYYYKLEAVSSGDLFGPIHIKVSAPRQFSLDQNYPNPFNPTTTIRYELPKTVQVTLTVYNLLGQEVRTLVDERQEAGFHTVLWNGRNTAERTVASGVYFYRLVAGEFTKAKKMVLVK